MVPSSRQRLAHGEQATSLAFVAYSWVNPLSVPQEQLID